MSVPTSYTQDSVNKSSKSENHEVSDHFHSLPQALPTDQQQSQQSTFAGDAADRGLGINKPGIEQGSGHPHTFSSQAPDAEQSYNQDRHTGLGQPHTHGSHTLGAEHRGGQLYPQDTQAVHQSYGTQPLGVDQSSNYPQDTDSEHPPSQNIERGHPHTHDTHALGVDQSGGFPQNTQAGHPRIYDTQAPDADQGLEHGSGHHHQHHNIQTPGFEHGGGYLHTHTGQHEPFGRNNHAGENKPYDNHREHSQVYDTQRGQPGAHNTQTGLSAPYRVDAQENRPYSTDQYTSQPHNTRLGTDSSHGTGLQESAPSDYEEGSGLPHHGSRGRGDLASGMAGLNIGHGPDSRERVGTEAGHHHQKGGPNYESYQTGSEGLNEGAPGLGQHRGGSQFSQHAAGMTPGTGFHEERGIGHTGYDNSRGEPGYDSSYQTGVGQGSGQYGAPADSYNRPGGYNTTEATKDVPQDATAHQPSQLHSRSSGAGRPNPGFNGLDSSGTTTHSGHRGQPARYAEDRPAAASETTGPPNQAAVAAANNADAALNTTAGMMGNRAPDVGNQAFTQHRPVEQSNVLAAESAHKALGNVMGATPTATVGAPQPMGEGDRMPTTVHTQTLPGGLTSVTTSTPSAGMRAHRELSEPTMGGQHTFTGADNAPHATTVAQRGHIPGHGVGSSATTFGGVPTHNEGLGTNAGAAIAGTHPNPTHVSNVYRPGSTFNTATEGAVTGEGTPPPAYKEGKNLSKNLPHRPL